MKALILNNKIIDISESEFPVSSEMEWIDLPENGETGWELLENGSWKPNKPSDVHVWNGSSWVVDSQLFDENFQIELKAYRDRKAKVIVSVNDEGTTNYLDAINDDENRNIIMGIINLLMIANDDTMTINWKGASGFQVGRLQDFQGLVLAGGLLTQKAFNAEKTVLENHAQTPYTDDTWKTDFDTAMEA